MSKPTDNQPIPALAPFSNQALRDELKIREDARKAKEAQRKLILDQIVVTNLDLLLKFIPNHERTSCSDEQPRNAGRARCSRCVLLALKRAPEMAEDYRFEFSIMRKPEEDS